MSSPSVSEDEFSAATPHVIHKGTVNGDNHGGNVAGVNQGQQISNITNNYGSGIDFLMCNLFCVIAA